ncbi:nitroreductase family protein [Clostridium sp.]|uniref:nitroreductase family protein n=1 Tax=Clostridium sp. TaxID=1506 RepID=UPI002FCA90C5
MDFKELVNLRESTRAYLDKKVEREKLEICIEAARMAPSACNSQPWKFIVVDEENTAKKLSNMVYDPLIRMNKFALEVPAFIVAVFEKPNITSKVGGMIKGKDYTILDVGIATEHICLAAAEQGLGTCIIGWFKEKEMKELLNIPKGKAIALVITIGYPKTEKPRKKVRKELKDILSYNKYE